MKQCPNCTSKNIAFYTDQSDKRRKFICFTCGLKGDAPEKEKEHNG